MDMKKVACAAVVNGALTHYLMPGKFPIRILNLFRTGRLPTYVIGALGGALSTSVADNAQTIVDIGIFDEKNLMEDALLHGLSYLGFMWALNPNLVSKGYIPKIQSIAIGAASEVITDQLLRL